MLLSRECPQCGELMSDNGGTRHCTCCNYIERKWDALVSLFGLSSSIDGDQVNVRLELNEREESLDIEVYTVECTMFSGKIHLDVLKEMANLRELNDALENM